MNHQNCRLNQNWMGFYYRTKQFILHNLLMYMFFSDGIWNFHITTAGPDKLPKIYNKSSQKSGEVSIVVYGSKATKGPIELTIEDRHMLLPGKVDLFEVS